MYCINCGQQLREASNFCSQCGKGIGPKRRPTLSAEAPGAGQGREKIAGVCAGFARYIGVDVTLVRLVWLLIALTGGVGFIAYIVAWIAMPLEDEPVYSSVEAHPNTLAKI